MFFWKLLDIYQTQANYGLQPLINAETHICMRPQRQEKDPVVRANIATKRSNPDFRGYLIGRIILSIPSLCIFTG